MTISNERLQYLQGGAERLATITNHEIAHMIHELLRRRKAEEWRDIITMPNKGTVLCGFYCGSDWHTSITFDPQQAKVVGLYTHWRPLPAGPEVKP